MHFNVISLKINFRHVFFGIERLLQHFILAVALHFVYTFTIDKISNVHNKFRSLIIMGGIQNLEWSNVERPIFRNFKITNIKIEKDELFDYFIYEFIFYYF